jgi:hypothetical protein
MHQLEEKDRRVADIETRLQRALAEGREIASDRDRLKAAGELEANAAAELRAQLENGEAATSDASCAEEHVDKAGPAEPVQAQAALKALQEKHARTLAELEAVSSLYHAALQDITKLAAELEESRLQRSEQVDSVLDSPSSTIRLGTDDGLPSEPPESPSLRVRTRRSGTDSGKPPLSTQNPAVSPGKDFHGGRGHTNQAQSRQVAVVIPTATRTPSDNHFPPPQAAIACTGALIIGIIAFFLGRFW